MGHLYGFRLVVTIVTRNSISFSKYFLEKGGRMVTSSPFFLSTPLYQDMILDSRILATCPGQYLWRHFIVCRLSVFSQLSGLLWVVCSGISVFPFRITFDCDHWPIFHIFHSVPGRLLLARLCYCKCQRLWTRNYDFNWLWWWWLVLLLGQQLAVSVDGPSDGGTVGTVATGGPGAFRVPSVVAANVVIVTAVWGAARCHWRPNKPTKKCL